MNDLTARIDAALIADGYDPDCVTWVCDEHSRHCTLIGQDHGDHSCYWCEHD